MSHILLYKENAVIRTRTHAHTFAHTCSHRMPPFLKFLTTVSFFFFYLQSTQQDTEKNLTEIFNYHLSLFSYCISFWKYFLKQLLNDAKWKKNGTFQVSRGGSGQREKDSGSLLEALLTSMPCFISCQSRNPSKVRVPLLCQYKHSKWTFSTPHGSHNPTAEEAAGCELLIFSDSH